MAETAQYLTLGLDGETFGIAIRNVREILDMRPISKIPHAPNFLLGIIDVRGTSYPIVDLRTKLDLPSVPATEATRIIILDVPMGDRSSASALSPTACSKWPDRRKSDRAAAFGGRPLEVGLSGWNRPQGRQLRHHLRSRQPDGVRRRCRRRSFRCRRGLADAVAMLEAVPI